MTTSLFLLLDSILKGFEIIALIFVISYLKGKAESSIVWFVAVCGLVIGITIYLMQSMGY